MTTDSLIVNSNSDWDV